ncbi:MAG: adenine deaminase [Clostridiales bacterium]|nr:adenine deaminase [Clostridiales bacterium]
MELSYTKQRSECAKGVQKSELVIKNGSVVNVFTNEIIRTDIAVEDGIIVGLGSYEGKTEIDADGKIICPGFIDPHLHLESTLVLPSELIDCAAENGTTTFIVDPHEAANVSGAKGIDYILSQTENVPANVYVMMPSCVPATSVEDNGAVIDAETMKGYIDNPRILGLGEVMDCHAVLDGDKNMTDKLKVFRNKVIDGHSGYLHGKDLMCYKLAGVDTDHECCDFETALEEVRAGFQVHIREGSAAKNLDAIVSGIVKNKIPTQSFSFCTDDKHITEIREKGHISYNVRRSVELGIDPIEAIKMATINPAKAYGLPRTGAVAPGYRADLIIMSNLKDMEIEEVLYNGKPVKEQQNGKKPEIDKALFNTVKIKDLSSESFKLPVKAPECTVIEVIKNQILTSMKTEAVPVKNGEFAPNETYSKIAVFERHRATGKKYVGIAKNYGIRNGAIASTFSHDSHNLIVIGDNDEDMLAACRALAECGGGYAISNGGEVTVLELPVMGLISNRPYDEVKQRLAQMIETAHNMGVPDGIDPFVVLSFLSLTVIPEVRITPRGIFDVIKNDFLNQS